MEIIQTCVQNQKKFEQLWYTSLLKKTKIHHRKIWQCFLYFYCNDKIQIYFQTSSFIKLYSNIAWDSLQNDTDPNVDD